MATAKKTPAPVVKKAVKAAAPAKTIKAKAAAPAKSAKPVVKAAPAKAAKAVKAAPAKAVKAAPAALKPLKTAFNKSSLAAHVADQSGVDAKSVKSVLAALEGAMLMSVNKKGLGSFTLPGLLKVVVQNVPAKKKRMGKDPFTGVERMFAAKPASVKIKTRALKKLKDAAL
ncbi:MAG: HU family DNA-binding protein [Caulobacter sp.]|nr:HU family DNA-binding protein [Vitreoscilla sp.]